MTIPDDLVALPTMPYSERPAELPLDTEEVRTALWMSNGNITRAAEVLKVPSIRLRTFVKRSAYLVAEMQEAADRIVDIAESNVLDALQDEQDASRRDTMSRFVLTNIGKHRGWGSGGNSLNIKNSPGGIIQVQWGDGTQLGKEEPKTEVDMKVIEGEVIDDNAA